MEARKYTITSAAAVTAIAALLLFVFGLYPLANDIAPGAVPWYAHASRFWLLVGGSIIMALFALGRLITPVMDRLWDVASRAVLALPAPVFVGVAALFAFLASARLAAICFGRQPHNADEVAQLFHAKILLSGRLSLPLDPNPEFFGMDNMIEGPRWYSQFPIGGPAFLAIGVALGAAWLVNPALLGLTVIAAYQFTRRAYGEGLARATTLLLALCPFALFMSASFMNHVPVLFLAAVAMAQLTLWVDAEDRFTAFRSAAFIGVALGVAFTVRPLDALVVAAAIGTMQVTRLRGSPARVRSLGVQIVAGLISTLPLFVVNERTNGAPLRLGYEVLYGSAHQLGFHADPYGLMHTPMRALVLASKYLLQLNVMMFGWPIPVVAVIVLGLALTRRPSRWDLFLVMLILAQVIAYALYWHDGSFRGPRFLFTALPALIILTARTPFLLASSSSGAVRSAARFALPVCMAIVWFAGGVGSSVPASVRQYQRLAAVTRVDPDSLEHATGLHNALVFINEGREARNLHDLWALGLSRGNAARVMVSASACAVRLAIIGERERRPADSAGRLDRVVLGARALDSREPPLTAPECDEDARKDNAGTASFAPFFPANDIDATGRLGGDVIYALDLGEHNESLRSRFGDRTWYRFGPLGTPRRPLPKLLPYSDAP
ncbi:MAG: glycosyltransferase family 39 protein [Gemmatimonadota bacterium]